MVINLVTLSLSTFTISRSETRGFLLREILDDFLFFYSKHYRIKATLILSPSFRLPYIIDHGGGEGRGGGVCAL